MPRENRIRGAEYQSVARHRIGEGAAFEGGADAARGYRHAVGGLGQAGIGIKNDAFNMHDGGGQCDPAGAAALRHPPHGRLTRHADERQACCAGEGEWPINDIGLGT